MASSEEQYFQFIDNGSQVEIYHYFGDQEHIVVPELLGNKPVTSITGFEGNKHIVSIVLPKSGETIRLLKYDYIQNHDAPMNVLYLI